ncbi:hypothetical protein CEUSTIGMA_g194.t1 [Chlamydomonas eustigma]|uniref:Uncharacterized protein n=1 Tax=Chlamydomonas eustigma TaxID=1157962 RepID=A0A250WPH6_9CHLO|nr:hypothetical protein CEUSTIGMA_g194.t1 [Chlamydomonas eustigma]|eukprot:GAX72738.1 hypothetical protein CEUSTIGMA_g194.t1 [Chlamydomonas eustigma]
MRNRHGTEVWSVYSNPPVSNIFKAEGTFFKRLQSIAMLIFVKRHFNFKTTVEAIYADAENSVEELEYGVRLEDAAWFTLEEKWKVLDPKIKIKDLPKILHGDGRTPETAFEAKFRIGGVLVDGVYYTGYYLAYGMYYMFSWALPKSLTSIKKSEDPAESINC